MTKLFVYTLIALLTSSVISGCSNQKKQEEEVPKAGYIPGELSIRFVPLQNAETLETKAKSLEKYLGDKLGIPVKISASPDNKTILEEMAARKIDAAYLPPAFYVAAKARGAAEVILQAQKYGSKQRGGENSPELVDSYKAMFLVKKGSPIRELKDLKGKKIAWQDAASYSGYIYPAAELKKAGVDPEKDVQGKTVSGHDKGVLSVVNGEVDAAAVFDDARDNLKKEYPDIFDKVEPIYYTNQIPNDTICVRSDMDKAWVEKIQNAFMEVASTPEGLNVLKNVFLHMGYAKAEDKNFDTFREYQKAVVK